MPINKIICKVYNIKKTELPNIKYHVFISKQATLELSQYIISENWGKNNSCLYNYLDHVWRLQLIDNMVKIFNYKDQKRVVFHTGLFSKINNKPIYLCLVPNETFCDNWTRVTQPWRVACNKGSGKNVSFVTETDLIETYKLNKLDIPIRTNFESELKKYQYNPEYIFIMDLNERFKGIYNKMINTIKNDIGFTGFISIYQLKSLINNGISKTLNKCRISPNIVTHQVYINSNSTKYNLELLLPLTININNKDVYFSLVCKVNNTLRQYKGINIIDRGIAYTNSRLIGKINVSWLKPFINCNTIDNNDNSKSNMHINGNFINNINYYDRLSMNYINNPFIYLATILPLKLPKLNIASIKQRKISCNLSVSNTLQSQQLCN